MIRDTTVRAALLIALAALIPAAARGGAEDFPQEFHLFSDSPPGARFADVHWAEPPAPPLNLASAARFEPAAWRPEPAGFTLSQAASGQGKARPEKLFTTATTVWTAAIIAGGFMQGVGAPLQYGWVPFNVTDEGWFGRDTYTGGADKVSHFILSSGVSRMAYEVYTDLGHSPDTSFTLAASAAFMSGVMVELLDSWSVYGFSFQDLTADALGSMAGVLIQRNGLQDLLGLRIGLVETPIPESAIGDSVPTLGRSYNDEIYAGDLKLGGLIRRMNGNPGFARFFLTSFVFFTKGFGYDPPLPSRYQEIGFEVGLNFTEILRALGVSERTWWGQGLIAVFDFFRFPFTQIGVYYNLYDGKWYGPGAPRQYY